MSFSRITAACLVLLGANLAAQVPHLISYQGRVTDHGTNFNGIGQFKFALVSGGSNMTAQATATATVINGFLIAAPIVNPGAGYLAAPAVTVTDATGAGAVLQANIANGLVTGISVLDAGFGYSAPMVTIAPPANMYAFRTFWSNDGTSSDGGEPAAAIELPVAQGLFSLLLGDTNLPNMLPIPHTVFTNGDVRLRIWFNDGAGAWQQLSPDQRISAVGYAMMAAGVPDGAITSAKLAPGAVGAAQLADGAITSAKLATNATVATPPGSIVLSQDADATNLLAAGYVRLPDMRVVTDDWEFLAARNPIPPLSAASTVFTGSEIVFWGDHYRNSGGRYILASNTWIATSSNNAPEPRWGSTAVWTGSRMIVWGGVQSPGAPPTNLNTGGIYDPGTDTWITTSTNGAPSARAAHAAVWTGSEMIIWGGYDHALAADLNTGGRYNPISNQWTTISMGNAPSPRGNLFAAWTGSEMVVWGGNGTNNNTRNSGALYNPASDTWTAISPMLSPEGVDISPVLQAPTLPVWTGVELVIWDPEQRTAGRYNPSTDTWRSMNPSGPYAYVAVLANESIAYLSESDRVPAAFYSLAADSWSFFPVANGALASDTGFKSAAWTGESFVILFHNRPSHVVKYTPRSPLYLYQRP